MQDRTLPPSLAAEPNIPWEEQTLAHLRAERAHWAKSVGLPGRVHAEGLMTICDEWIARRTPNRARVAPPGKPA
jgi:hypothetical protein